MDKYWRISHTADTTETGFVTRRTYVRTIWQGFRAQQSHEQSILSDYCFERFGNQTAYVQGVAPCLNWKIAEINESDFEKATPIKWGGIATKTEKIVLGIGNRGMISTLYTEVKEG